MENDAKGYTPSGPRSVKGQWRDRPLAATSTLMGAPEDAESAFESPANRPAVKGQQARPPSWWDPPPSIHVDQRYQQQVQLVEPCTHKLQREIKEAL